MSARVDQTSVDYIIFFFQIDETNPKQVKQFKIQPEHKLISTTLEIGEELVKCRPPQRRSD